MGWGFKSAERIYQSIDRRGRKEIIVKENKRETESKSEKGG